MSEHFRIMAAEKRITFSDSDVQTFLEGEKTIMRTRHKLFVSFCRIKAGATEPRPLE